jgi:hypothetical protein
MTLVNGYVCRDCTDEELAKRGVDPAHPKDAPKGVRAAADKKSEAEAPLSKEELGVNHPAAVGSLGTRLNILA